MRSNKSFEFDEEVKRYSDKEAGVKGVAGDVWKNTKDTLNYAKSTVITMQRGAAVLAAVKSSLLVVPGLPDSVKEILESKYGDLIVGVILSSVGPSVVTNPLAGRAMRDASTVGVVRLSEEFDFLKRFIEGVVLKAAETVGEGLGDVADFGPIEPATDFSTTTKGGDDGES